MKQFEVKKENKIISKVMYITGALFIYTASFNPIYADGIMPPSSPIKNMKVPPKLLIQKSTISVYQRPKINIKTGKKPDLVIENKGGKKSYREIDYYSNGYIVFPFSGFGYDSDGIQLHNNSLNWSYRMKGMGWKNFGKGRAVKLSIYPDSTQVPNNIYKIDVRLSAKNKWGRTGQEMMTISVLSIAR